MHDLKSSAASGDRPAAGELRLPNLLIRNRNFVLLWAAYGVAAIGDHLSEMALMRERNALGQDRPEATRVQALLMFGFFLPFMFFAPLAGWWSDRFSRKYTMIGADLLRALVVVNLGVIVHALDQWLEPGDALTPLGDYSIIIPVAVIGGLAAFFSPARQAMLPTLVRDDQLVRANAMINALGTIGTILGGVLGGIMVQKLPLQWSFYVNSVTFVLSAVFVSLIAMSRTRAVPHPPLEGVWTPIREGFRYVRRHRRVLQLIMLVTVFWAAASVVGSVAPAIAKAYYGSNYLAASLFRGLMIFGLAAGAAVMAVIGPTMPLQTAIMLSLAGAIFWVVALDVAYMLGAAVVITGLCLIGLGGAGAALLVTIVSSIQHFVPDARRGRVFGVTDMSATGAMVLASGALGVVHIPNLDRWIPALLAVVAAGFAAAFITAWRHYRRNDPYPPVLSVMWRLLTFYSRFMFRVKRDGPCTIPRTGPVILAANHTAGIDPILIYATCRYRVISFLVEQQYYEVPVANWFQRLIDCIPINRANPGKTTIATILRLLKDGGCLGIFPQGTFERPGEEVESKAGIGMFALRTGATVIPCHISGTVYSDSVAKTFFLRQNVRVKYGKPVDLSEFVGREKDKAAQDAASEKIMCKIRELAPPESLPAAAPQSARS